MGGPLRPGIFDWRRQVLQMVIFVAFIGALGYAVSKGSFDFMANEVTLTIEPNRTLVDLGSSEPPVIQLHIKLKNNTSAPVPLEAESSCKIVKWIVLAKPGMDLVQAKGGKEVECADQPLKQTLAPGQELDEFYALELIPARYTTAGDYEARVKYWGYTTVVPFSVKLKSP